MKVPVIGSHIEIFPYEGNKINIYNKASRKTYLIGEKEAQVLVLLDGNHTLSDITNICPFYTQDEIDKLITAFSDIGLFEEAEKKQNIFRIRKRLFSPNALFQQNDPITKVLFYLIMIGCPATLILGITNNILMLYSGSNSVTSIASIVNEFANFGGFDIFIIYISSILCLALHELSHTITARYYGVNVPEIGVMLYFFIPCAYTNISGINLLKSRKQRLVILASGNLTNLGLIGMFYMLLNAVNAHIAACMLGLIIVNAGTVFLNGMIFLKFDGYYMLEVFLNETQLREKASAYFKQYVVLRLCKDKTVLSSVQEEVKRNYDKHLVDLTYIVFSLLSIIYIPLLLANTVISALSLA